MYKSFIALGPIPVCFMGASVMQRQLDFTHHQLFSNKGPEDARAWLVPKRGGTHLASGT